MEIIRVEAFQIRWDGNDDPARRSAFVRIHADNELSGIGEASPMRGGAASLGIIERDIGPSLIGADPLDHAVLHDRLLHGLVKLGPEGALSGALAAIDIALWDLKGKLLGQPIYKLLGGAWRTTLPFYASIGHNGAGERDVDEVCRVVERRLKDGPAAVKIRFDSDRVTPDLDIKGDIAKARAVRRLVGDDFPLAFDANNGYSVGGAIRVGRALEELGYWWFEEPVQHYHVARTGEVAGALDITVSAGEQTYTTAGVVDLINAGVRMVQPDIVKMGGISGLLRCAAVCQGAWRGTGAASDAADHWPHGQSARLRCADARDQTVRVGRPVITPPRRVRQSTEAEGRAVSFADRSWAWPRFHRARAGSETDSGLRRELR